jgi:hypothetical protein
MPRAHPWRDMELLTLFVVLVLTAALGAVAARQFLVMVFQLMERADARVKPAAQPIEVTEERRKAA